MKTLLECLMNEEHTDNKDFELLKFVKQHSAEYYDWLRWGDEGDDYKPEFEKKFQELQDNEWEEADESFDYTDEAKAKRYVAKMEKKGYDVVEVDDGSDTFIYLIHKK